MSVSYPGGKKRYGLFALAVGMLLIGAVALFLEWNNFARGLGGFLIWSIGLLMIVSSTYLVKISNVHARSSSVAASDPSKGSRSAKGPGLRMWLLGAASLAALGISYHYLYKDALAGYHQMWPVYAFAGSGLVCAIVLGYLFARLSK